MIRRPPRPTVMPYSTLVRAVTERVAMLFHNSEHVTGPNDWSAPEPSGAGHALPSGGAASGAERGPTQRKPMRETSPRARETRRGRRRSTRGANPWRDAGLVEAEVTAEAGPVSKLRRGRSRRRRSGPREAGIPGGRAEPHECCPGKPGRGWTAEQTVEVVETTRAERSGRQRRSSHRHAGAGVDAAILMR